MFHVYLPETPLFGSDFLKVLTFEGTGNDRTLGCGFQVLIEIDEIRDLCEFLTWHQVFHEDTQQDVPHQKKIFMCSKQKINRTSGIFRCPARSPCFCEWKISISCSYQMIFVSKWHRIILLPIRPSNRLSTRKFGLLNLQNVAINLNLLEESM